jgi:hypothetical protein
MSETRQDEHQGTTDLAAIVNYEVEVFFGLSPTAVDRSQNGVPDSCESSPFRRGDTNGDDKTSIADAIFLFCHLFLGGLSLDCLESADANNDGRLDISDGLAILNFLFLGGPSPPEPGPPPSPCGPDPDPPDSPSHLGCPPLLTVPMLAESEFG